MIVIKRTQRYDCLNINAKPWERNWFVKAPGTLGFIRFHYFKIFYFFQYCSPSPGHLTVPLGRNVEEVEWNTPLVRDLIQTLHLFSDMKCASDCDASSAFHIHNLWQMEGSSGSEKYTHCKGLRSIMNISSHVHAYIRSILWNSNQPSPHSRDSQDQLQSNQWRNTDHLYLAHVYSLR